MKMTVAFSQQRQLQPRLRLWSAITVFALMAGSIFAQSPAVRIPAEINDGQQTVLPGSRHPLAQAQFDAGRVPFNTKLNGVTIFFNRSPQQEADLLALLKAQQDPGSPQYHQWLTPDQFAARFGMADSDLEKVQGWLERQGFAIDSTNRSRNAIHYSGSVAQIEQAFSTQMHYYNVGGLKHFAPSTALSVPATMAPVVAGVLNLDDFRARSMHIHANSANAKRARPQYTFLGSDNNQYVLFAPGDIKIAYDINPLIAAGNNGSGQTIAIMGQSAIEVADIENFQQAAGLTIKDPVLTLVPNTGASTVQADGDEGESDLDVEWSGSTAPGATIDFVYTGGNQNYGVFDAYAYAVDQKIGNVISLSYGSCETQLDQSEFTSLEAVGEQATSQGQTVVSASGDSGATACYGYTGTTDGGTPWTSSMQDALAVNYPASSAYVTGVGGTAITTADDEVGTYWGAAGNSGISLTTALSYIPEVAWNDDLFTITQLSQQGINCVTDYQCLSASGGGVSALTTRPSWQTGVPGIPSGTMRAVPDVALYASPNYPGYLYCTSDQSDWVQGQEGSCGDGQFYDPESEYFTIAGGTSFAAPIFAGELAILNQAKGYTTGQGLVNTQLYMLAANSTTYGTAFHDVTSGNNECTGSSSCPSGNGYSAGTGYDLVTGLGSLDLNNLVTAWSSSTTNLIGTTTTVSASSTAPFVNQSDTFTISVSANTGATVPAGSVSVSIDGAAATDYTLTTSGTAGTASFSYTFTTAGSHTVTASFAADTTFGGSTGSVTVNVQSTSSGSGSIAVSASPSTLTVSQGSQGTENVTVTPSNGYTGTVILNVDFGSSDSTLENLCLGFSGQGDVSISGTSAAAISLYLDTNAADCPFAVPAAKKGMVSLRTLMKNRTTAKNSPRNLLPEGVVFAGLLAIGFLGRRSRKLRGLVAVLLLATAGMALSACGSGNGGNTLTDPPKGTYTGTITAQDSATATINSTTTFTFVID